MQTDGVSGQFSIHATLGQTTLSGVICICICVLNEVRLGWLIVKLFYRVSVLCVRLWWRDGRKWNPVSARSLLLSIRTKGTTEIKIPITSPVIEHRTRWTRRRYATAWTSAADHLLKIITTRSKTCLASLNEKYLPLRDFSDLLLNVTKYPVSYLQWKYAFSAPSVYRKLILLLYFFDFLFLRLLEISLPKG